MLQNPAFYFLLAFFASLAVIPIFYRRLKNRKPKKMKLIRKYFEEYFSRWKIELPDKTFNERLNSYIHDCSGWLIQYCFGIENGLNYMDFYAYHNMTNDSHIRIYENGETKDLTNSQSIWQYLQV